MDGILMEILNEVKSLAVKHAEIDAKLDSALLINGKQEEEIKVIQSSIKAVHEHSVIIKAMLWVYGIIVSFIVSREIQKFL